MSRKPNQQVDRKISTSTLLPNVFRTEPNKKMLTSTLDVAMSKGQLLNFNQTFGLRSASAPETSFFVKESDPVREESQTNLSYVINNDTAAYLGKADYLDIHNYFKVQGLALKSPSQLDSDVLNLDLPVNSLMLTEFQQYYWLPYDLPIIELDFSNPISLQDSVIGKPYATLVDDSGKSLILADGMKLIFYGSVDANFVTAQEDLIKLFYVSGVGSSIKLTNITRYDYRIPLSSINNVPWDSDLIIPLSLKGWGGAGSKLSIDDPNYDPQTHIDSWDSITFLSAEPEYVVMERYAKDNNPWSVINKWYHIGLIKTIAEYLDRPISSIASSINQAQRPIIQFLNNIEVIDWPKRFADAEIGYFGIQGYFPGKHTDSAYVNQTGLVDLNNYQIHDKDLVVFIEDKDVYRASINVNNNIITFSKVTNINVTDYSGLTLVSLTDKTLQKLICKFRTTESGTVYEWSYAQNKIAKNQAPRFEFYNIDGEKITDLSSNYITTGTNEISVPWDTSSWDILSWDLGGNYSTTTQNSALGGIILDFLSGTTYDPILEKNIAVSNIDFDIVSETNPRVVNSNQIKYRTDVDASVENNSGGVLSGPYKYNIDGRLVEFWNKRSGLDITPDAQTTTYKTDTEINWSAEVDPVINGFSEIHIFPSGNEIELFYRVNDRGYVRFTSKNSQSPLEAFLPLIASKKFNIVCHDLPHPVKFYRSEMNAAGTGTVLVDLESMYCDNNNISNGIITLDLTDSVLDSETELYVTNPFSEDLSKLVWKYNGINRNAVIRPIYKWRFLFNVFKQDKTYPIYHDYDFTVTDTTNTDGSIGYKQSFNATSLLNSKIEDGDKILIESLINDSNVKTAPVSLTKNPLNDNLVNINYYSLYQHSTDVYSGQAYIKEIIDTANLNDTEIHLKLTNGTIVKHNNPLSRFAVMATNFPFEFTDTLIKQGRHYDVFMSRFKSELQLVTDQYDSKNYSTLDLMSIALEKMYVNRKDESSFWYHSNMMGWGTSIGESVKVSATVTSTLLVPLGSPYSTLKPISFSAGKETVLHIVYDKKILLRNHDYTLESTIDGYYTGIRFHSSFNGRQVSIRQWNTNFKSRIPASLAKIGLAPVYRPEILEDATIGNYFMYRHDGTRYYLVDGVDEFLNPINLVDQLLWEYEKAVWSSIAHDIEHNSFAEYYQDKPGGFRGSLFTWNETRAIVNNDIVGWQNENNLFILNNEYDSTNPFTYRYVYGSGDEISGVEGSWRAIYKFYYDTDRPHSHPWEMLGYTLKPKWWDLHYSWTNPAKRTALERALRIGNRFEPPMTVADPFFARINDIDNPEQFPVDSAGNLIAPFDLEWLAVLLNTSEESLSGDWRPGDMSPYDSVFLNTQRGLASEIKLTYLLSPTKFIANNWVPGNTIQRPGLKLNKSTESWIKVGIDYDYHRKNSTSFTAGIESLYSEFCELNNINFYDEVVQKFNNLEIKKEFLLQGFTNKNSVKIESTSIANQSRNLFVPEENYTIRTVKHYPHLELFYSAMRIIWDGDSWIVYGFTNENPYFSYYLPKVGSATSAITVGNVILKQKTTYDGTKVYQLPYGTSFTNRQEMFDFIVGYGKYLTANGFKFEETEAGDIRDWQLSAKQFIFWSNDELAAGNYIDLNPAVDQLVLMADDHGQLENLAGNNQNPGWCIDRFGKNLFSKDLLVDRDSILTVKPKDPIRSIYGIKLTFAMYESVVHLDGTSVFNDIYFLPDQGTTKRSFKVGGKKSYTWDGKYFVHGYMFNGTDIIPNFDSFSAVGNDLLNMENSILDSTIVDASRAQFGLNRNPELRQLFLTDDVETQFKTSITFLKGTSSVFTSLEPLTHKNDNSRTIVNEEYMVRLGEFGNTKNIEYYEFQLRSSAINNRDYQLIDFTGTSNDTTFVVPSTDWVYTPYNKPLRFTLSPTNKDSSKLKTSGPVMPQDTDYAVNSLTDIPYLYKEFESLYTINHYDATTSYKKNDQVRADGKLYSAIQNAPVGTALTNTSYYVPINESYLPNIFVDNYNKENPNLAGGVPSVFTPGTWQVIQTVDREIGIEECCTGLTDTSLARISTNKAHKLQPGDYVLIVNADTKTSSANGIWQVHSLDVDTPTTRFFIDTRIVDTIKTGKLFTFKPVRFKNTTELDLAINNPEAHGYSWNKKFNPQSNALGQTNLVPPTTPSGFPSELPIAIVDNNSASSSPAAGYTYGFGNYGIYSVNTTKTLLKEESAQVDPSDIEQLVIYDHVTGQTLARVEMFDPKKLILPEAFINEIDVTGRVDPAKYNRTTDKFKTVYSSISWYKEYIGRRWWDTSTIQFADYDVGTNEDKYNNWGKTINNKTPDVYEWTKSPVPPAQWNKLADKKGDAFGVPASGEVYLDNDSGSDNYHWVEEQDFISGKTYTIYYFWVKNKNSIPMESKLARVYAVGTLSNILLNPSSVGLAWWAPISNSSIIVKGIKSHLNNSSTVVQIKKKLKGEEKNQQWLFVSEQDTVNIIPEWMHVRLRNSLSTVSVTTKNNGYVYKQVPDKIKLHKFNLLGNDIRPYQQTWFSNVVAARRVFLEQSNLLLKNIDVVRSITNWNDNLIPNYKFGDLTIDLSEDSGLWYKVDYESTSYNADKNIAQVVATQREIFTADLNVGDYIKVLNTDTIGLYVVYEKTDEGGFAVVYRENGTIQFTEKLKTATDPWDSVDLSSDNNKTIASISVIVDILRNDILIGNQAYIVNYNKLMCIMLRYVLSEQLNVNWLQKSSTVEPFNLIGQSLNRLPELERDNISVLTSFYSSVKAFRDKIRDSNIVKSTQELVQVHITETREPTIELYFERHNVGTPEVFDNIKATEFTKQGWDTESFDPGYTYYVAANFNETKANDPNIYLASTYSDVYSAPVSVGDYIKYITNFASEDEYTIFEKLDNGFLTVYQSDYLIVKSNPNFDNILWDSLSWDSDEYVPTLIDPDFDNVLWDTVPWDVDQFYNEQEQVTKMYHGGNATDDIILSSVQGTTQSRYKNSLRTPFNKNGTQGEELVYVSMPEGLTIDVEHQLLNTLTVKVRENYYQGMVEMFILDSSLASLVENVENDLLGKKLKFEKSMTIKLNSTENLPDANLDDIQYIWIGNEKIGYSIKTETHISGLIRGCDGTPVQSHRSSEPVYVVSHKTMLIPITPLQNLNLKTAFFNDYSQINWDSIEDETMAGWDNGYGWDETKVKTLENSENPFAKALINYVSS